jgi:acetyl/propionyl-CoA carboxylase alpha subunit
MSNDLLPTDGQGSMPVTVSKQSKRPGNIWLIIVAGLFIVVPFLTWYFTWFGRNLSEQDLATYLADEKNPRHIQHALLQIEQRIETGDGSAKKFYPQIVAVSKSAHAEIRKTAAWVMGQDNKSDEFHRALIDFLKDEDPLVRRNAALQLVRFSDANGRADASGRPELRAMLQPFAAKTPLAGHIVSLLPIGSAVRAGAMLARIRDSSDNVAEFRSPVDGVVAALAVKEGDAVQSGQTISSINPDRATLLNALQALAYVGTKDDLQLVEACTKIDAGAETTQQAAQTIKAIKSRD